LLESVRNTLRILKSYSREKPVLRVVELSRDLQIEKSSVSRILSTLAAEGFVVKDKASRGYRLGPSSLRLGTAYPFSHEICSLARPVLRELSEKIGETVQLGILDDMKVLFIESFESKHPLRIISSVGSYHPLHCSSPGKVLLAYQDESMVDEVIRKGLKPWTSKTITDGGKFKEEICKVRQQGYAFSAEEMYEGVLSIGVPVRDHMDQVVAAINVVGPIERMMRSGVDRTIRHLMRAAQDISEDLL